MSGRRILILDDSTVTLKMLIRALKSEGFIPRATPSIKTFGKLVEEFKPEMVLLDLAMPTKDGDQVCQEIQQRFPNRPIPVVMMSGLSEGELDQRSKAAGAYAYISKKHGFQAFVQSVTEIFQTHDRELMKARAARLNR